MHNDIWSLGIILLNLATGRNPWKSATADDPTFQAYLRGPMTFLPSVLPISSEVNKILVGMLDVDYRRRTPLRDVRRAIQRVTSFYSDGVIFEGSMARCPWESGMDIDTDSSEDTDPPLPRSPSPLPETSQWSKDTTSDIIFARQPLYAEESSYDEIPWTNRSSCGATWACESAPSSSSSSSSSESEPGLVNSDMFGGSRTPSETSIPSPVSSLPATPNSGEIAFGSKAMVPNRKPLTINTNIPQPRFHDDANLNTFSEDSAIMQTAIEYDPYSSTFYLTSAISESKVIALPASAITTTVVAEDKEMTSPSAWQAGSEGVASPSIYSRSSSRTSSSSSIISPRSVNRPLVTMLSPASVFFRSTTPSPEPNWAPLRAQPRQVPIITSGFFTEQSQHVSPVCDTITMTDAFSSPLSPPSSSRQSHALFPQPPTHTPTPNYNNAPAKKLLEGGTGGGSITGAKSKTNNLFGLKFFPRSPSPARTQNRATQTQTKSPSPKVPFISTVFANNTNPGVENTTGTSSGFQMGRFGFEPPRQASPSPCPSDANGKSCRSLVARNKKLAKAPDTEEACGRTGRGGRGSGKKGDDSMWFGTWDGGRSSRDSGFGDYMSQVISSGASVASPGASGMTVNSQEAQQQQDGACSSESVRQGRFSVNRRTRREERSRSPRHWFIPGRFFASAGAAA